jgi:hypothetical protein
VPTIGKVRRLGLRESGLIEDQARACSRGLQLERHDRVNPGRPVGRTPCLYDALIGCQFDLAPDDGAAKAGERQPRD